MKIVLFTTKVSSFVQGTQYNDIFNFRAWVRGDVKLELLHFFDRAKNRYKQYQKQSKNMILSLEYCL